MATFVFLDVGQPNEKHDNGEDMVVRMLFEAKVFVALSSTFGLSITHHFLTRGLPI